MPFKKPKPIEKIPTNQTKVYKSIIDDRTKRRSISTTDWCGENIIRAKNNKENWYNFGKSIHIDQRIKIVKDILKLRRNLKDKKKPVKVIILGAGAGKEISYINSLFKNKIEVSSYQLADSLSDKAKKVVRNRNHFPNLNNISPKDTFEHMNHLKFTNQFDYIYSHLGVGIHTKYPDIALLKVASMLRKGGIARIEVSSLPTENIRNIKEYLESKNLSDTLELKPVNEAFGLESYVLMKRLK